MALGVFALSLRLVNLGQPGLYWDEFLQVSAASGSNLMEPLVATNDSFTQATFWAENTVQRAVMAASSVGDPPLGTILLHYWLMWFGTSEVAARSFSLICGVLVALFTYVLATQLLDEGPARWAGALAAMHPLLVRYSQEARGRMFATLVALIATVLFVQLWQRVSLERWQRTLIAAGYAVTAAAAILTHLMSSWIFLAHFIAAALFFRRRSQWAPLLIGGLLAVTVVAAVLSLSWIPHGGPGMLSRTHVVLLSLARAGKATNPFIFPSTGRYLAAGILQVAYSMSGNDILALALNHGFQLRHLIPLLSIPVALLASAWSARGTLGEVRDAWSVLAILSAAPPLAAVAIAIVSGHIMALRPHYAVFATPYLVVMLGAGMAVAASRLGRAWRGNVLLLAQFTCLACALWSVYRDDALWQRPPNVYRELASTVTAAAQPGDIVVYPRWFDARLTNLYLPERPLLRQRVVSTEGADASLRFSWGLPNTPEGEVRLLPARREAIWVLRTDGTVRARLDNPALF